MIELRRKLQKKLAEEVTKFVHSEKDLNVAVAASKILFGKSTKDDLLSLDEEDFLGVFSGVPQVELAKSEMMPPPENVSPDVPGPPPSIMSLKLE